MTQIARHIATVQARRTTQEFLAGSVYAAIGVAALITLGIIANRLSPLAVPHPIWAVIILLAAAVAGAIIFAVRKRPTSRQAAAMIDQSLELRERFSTAIFVQDREDAFSRAVCADAEELAGQITLRGKFPLRAPRWTWLAVATLIIALLLGWLFPIRAGSANGQIALQQQQQAAARQVLAEAIQKIEAQAKTFGDDAQIQKAKSDLQKEFNSPPRDSEQAKRDAAQALQQVAQAANQKSQQSQAAAQSQRNMLSQLNKSPNQTGSIAEAQKAIAQNNPAKASQSIAKATEEAKSQTPTQRQSAARQLQQLSQSLNQVAQNQQTQKALQNQLQQMGLNSQQIQQLQNTPANQQNQALSQMKSDLSPLQQSQAMQLMQKLSADAKNRSQMQSLSKSAEKMSQAMQQNDARQMAQASQEMQKQMSDMQSQQQSASEQSRQASAAQQSAEQSMQSLNGNGAQSNQGQPSQSTTGQPTPGNGNGGGSSTQGGHEHAGLVLAPPTEQPAFSIRIEAPPPGSQSAGGKVLADFLVKGGSEKGEAHEQLQHVITTAQQQAPEDADPETIDAGARRTVKEYFQAVQENK